MRPFEQRAITDRVGPERRLAGHWPLPPRSRMLYLANPTTRAVRNAMRASVGLGAIDTPAQGNIVPAHTWWAADNGVFGKGYPGDAAYLEWLADHRGDRELCLFAAAPDVVGNAAATEVRSRPLLERIRVLGYSAALVAQDGMEWSTWDCWDEIDALFIGGSTAWKLGPYVAEIVAVARSIGRWVHMGRVNSGQRWEHATAIGCDSVDGTFLTFGPHANLPKVLGWLRSREQAALLEDHRDLYGPPHTWDGGALYTAASQELRQRGPDPVAAEVAAGPDTGSQLDLFGAAA